MIKDDLRGRRIVVLGAGVSGAALAKLALKKGADVLLSDAGTLSDRVRSELDDKKIPYETGSHSDRVFEADSAVVSSGFPQSAEIIKKITAKNIPVIGELDFVSTWLTGKFIAITGSNGKTTTTSLTGFLLESLGYRTAIVGNIGKPLADAADESYDFIVAELSSFQLHWSQGAKIDIGIITNLAPDHIDWHGSYEKYVEAKARLLSLVGGDGVMIIQESDRSALGVSGEKFVTLAWSEARRTDGITLSAVQDAAYFGGEQLFTFRDTTLLGRHNVENAAMALCALRAAGADHKKAVEYLKDYVPPPHRCALVADIAGVRYIDDSKGTNIAATVTALSSIDGRKIIILGGKGKGEDYRNLLPALEQYAKRALLIGEAAHDIAEAFNDAGYRNYTKCGNLENAVNEARKLASSGDVVLLSPACTSWDSYKNYGERGDHFAALVKEGLRP